MDFWIIIDQRHAGPFSLEQLREQGITPDRLVWHDGLTDWTPAREVPALAELFATEPVASADPCPPVPAPEDPSEAPEPLYAAESPEEPRQQPQHPDGQPQQQAPCGAQPNQEFHYGGNYGPQQQAPYGAQQQPPYGAPQQPYGQPYNQQQQPYGGAPQQPQYAPGQQPFNQVPPCPPTYLAWAIIATVCCCTPLGIVAIIYAANIKNAYYRGDYMKAVRNSNRAQAWIIAAIVLGLLYIPLQMVYMGIFDMLSNL